MDSTASPLKVIVIGAGIAGLTAALGLRRQGHHVFVYERSSLLKEYGAAISIGPNANAVLRRLGLFLEKDAGAVENNGFVMFQGDEVKHVEDQRAHFSQYKHPYHFVLRQDLHRGLIEITRKPEGHGHPVTITTSAKVVDVSPHEASITLESGEIIKGDVVIGGDGVHSRSRNKIPGAEEIRERPFGKSAYRCLMPMQGLLDDPKTKPLAEHKGHFVMWTNKEPRQALIMYPGAGGTRMNLATTQDNETVDFNAVGETLKGQMRSEYGAHSQMIDALCEKIEPSSLGIWSYNDMNQMPSFIDGKLALIGDAAHPFLPFFGQGGAMAIEDAAAIAALLPLGTKPEDIKSRLQLYEKARFDRDNIVQSKTRDSIKKPDINRGHPLLGTDEEGLKLAEWLYSFDAWDESEKLLRASVIS